MGKLITKEDGYEIRLGQKNPTCCPCCFEGSVCACRSDLCIKHRDNYIREHGKLPQGGGGRYLSQTSEVMNEEDTSLYGKNREGKVALCETCAYDGYCRDKIRYYRCRNYIKIKDDYEPTKTNPTGDRNDGCGSK